MQRENYISQQPLLLAYQQGGQRKWGSGDGRKDSGKCSPYKNNFEMSFWKNKEMGGFLHLSLSLSRPGREYLKYNL